MAKKESVEKATGKVRKRKNGKRTMLSFDYAMKKLLRRKGNFAILEGFLSELLERDVRVKSILESESNRDDRNDKQTRVDVVAEEADGNLILVEVQYHFQIDYLLRILYGVSRTLVEYVRRGEPYGNIRKIYSVSILYFPEYHDEDEYVYHGKTIFSGKIWGKIMRLNEQEKKRFKVETAGDLYPEFYLLDVTNFDDEARSKLDEWVYYFKNSEIMDDFSAKGMKEARKHLDFEKLSPEEKRQYEKTIDEKLGWDSSINTAKEDGFEKGKEEGIEIGKEEGIEIGRHKERETLVLNLSGKGFSAEQIVELTNLSMETVADILQLELVSQ